MGGPAARLLADSGCAIGESPLWLGDAVLWTDPVARRLFRFADVAGPQSTPVDRAIWSLAGLRDGTIAGALDDAFCTVDPSGAITPSPATKLDLGCRFNDMTVDASGGLWVGAMHRGVLATRGAIYHAASLDSVPRRVAEGLGVPNGMKVSEDGRTLYVIDTLARMLLAYPIVPDGLDEPAIVSDFLGLAGKPDGMTIASDGSFWVAMWGGGSVVQLAPDGATLREIAIPAPHVSSLCFAAPDRMHVTTSRMRLSPQILADHPGSGGLFEVRL
jgi:xylono-1,5-lactonase